MEGLAPEDIHEQEGGAGEKLGMAEQQEVYRLPQFQGRPTWLHIGHE